MIELPEALTLSSQLSEAVSGKRVAKVTAAHTPHKFAWYFGDHEKYDELLRGKIVNEANGFGGMVEIKAEGAVMLFGDGVGLRFHAKNDHRPQKHQLLIEFEDLSAISAAVQMYGGLWCFEEGEFITRIMLLPGKSPQHFLKPLTGHILSNFYPCLKCRN